MPDYRKVLTSLPHNAVGKRRIQEIESETQGPQGASRTGGSQGAQGSGGSGGSQGPQGPTGATGGGGGGGTTISQAGAGGSPLMGAAPVTWLSGAPAELYDMAGNGFAPHGYC